MKQKNFFIILTYICLIAVIVYLIGFAEPKVIIDSTLEPIKETEESDYREVILRYDFRIVQPLYIISDRNIVIDNLDKVIMNDDRVRYISGSNYRMDNSPDNEAEYGKKAKIALKEMKISEFIELLDDFKITVSWNKKLGGEEKRVYYLKDYLYEED